MAWRGSVSSPSQCPTGLRAWSRLLVMLQLSLLMSYRCYAISTQPFFSVSPSYAQVQACISACLAGHISWTPFTHTLAYKTVNGTVQLAVHLYRHQAASLHGPGYSLPTFPNQSGRFIICFLQMCNYSAFQKTPQSSSILHFLACTLTESLIVL